MTRLFFDDLAVGQRYGSPKIMVDAEGRIEGRCDTHNGNKAVSDRGLRGNAFRDARLWKSFLLGGSRWWWRFL